jgi:hypothetical protein
MGLEIAGFTRANLGSLWIDPADYQAELSASWRIAGCRSATAVKKRKIAGVSVRPQKSAAATTYGPFRRNENRTPADFSVEYPFQVC